MIRISRNHLLAAVIALFALVRLTYLLGRGLLVASVFMLAVAACLQNTGVLSVPYIGSYLEKIPIDASVTLIGILIATFGALGAWRRQKKEELLTVSTDEIALFFDQSLQWINLVQGYVRLLKEFQGELLAGPYPMSSLWRATHLSERVEEVNRALKDFQQTAVLIHGVDAKYVQVLTSHPTLFNLFLRSKAALLQLVDRAAFGLPVAYPDPADFISYLRLMPVGEYDKFLEDFGRLTGQIAAGAGGIRAAAHAKFFPPTLTFAKAIFNVERNP